MSTRFATFFCLDAQLMITTNTFRHATYHVYVYIHVYVCDPCMLKWKEKLRIFISFPSSSSPASHQLKKANGMPDILQVLNLVLFPAHQHPLGIYISPAICDYIKQHLSSLLLAATKDDRRSTLPSMETVQLSSWDLPQVLYWFVYGC